MRRADELIIASASYTGTPNRFYSLDTDYNGDLEWLVIRSICRLGIHERRSFFLDKPAD